jgi:hypothetical protein
VLPQLLDHLIETGLQGLRGDRVEHQTNVVVGRNLLHSEQSMAIRCAVALLQPPLMGQKGLTLHEKQGKRRKPNIRHRVAHIRAAPCIGKAHADRAQPGQKRLQYLHTSKQHSSSLRQIATWVPIFI